jgi:hypothetical protein
MTAMGDAVGPDAACHILEGLRLLADRAPRDFLGYVGLRQCVFRAPPPWASRDLDEEFIFVLLDIQAGNIRGARNHPRNAMSAGLTVTVRASVMAVP